METLQFQCPACRKKIQVNMADCGKNIRCPECSELVNVPLTRTSPGAIIADFLIIREIGQGGMGTVYLSHQLSLDRPSALKILRSKYTANADFVISFIREARAAAKLNHPHIVQAYAVGEENGIFYFAMEYVEGETMKEILKQTGKIPLKDALQILEDIASALDYAWGEQRLVHRDIKPDNIILGTNGNAKLADLGLARVSGEVSKLDSEDKIMGTPQYISPELLIGAHATAVSDIYSLGATFYHFITGQVPFSGNTADDIAQKHLSAELKSPSSVNSEIPRAVSNMVMRMMARNPSRRYQSSAQLFEDIRKIRKEKDFEYTSGKQRVSVAPTTSQTIIADEPPVKRTNSTVRLTGEYRVGKSDPEKLTINQSSTAKGLRKMKENREFRSRRFIILLVLCLIFILFFAALFIKWLVFMPMISTQEINEKIRETKEKIAAKRISMFRKKQRKEKANTAYLAAANTLFEYAAKNPQNREEIRLRCAEFLIRFPYGKNEKERACEKKVKALFESVSSQSDARDKSPDNGF